MVEATGRQKRRKGKVGVSEGEEKVSEKSEMWETETSSAPHPASWVKVDTRNCEGGRTNRRDQKHAPPFARMENPGLLSRRQSSLSLEAPKPN